MKHEVTLDLSTKFVLNKDVTVSVKADGKKLGTLLISKGDLQWLPANASVNKKRLTWTKFSELIEAEGKTVRIKKKVAPV